MTGRAGAIRILCVLAALAALAAPALAAGKVLYKKKSLYRNLTVTQDGDERCLRFTTKLYRTRQSCVDVSDPDRLVLPYTPLIFGGLLINDTPRRVLVLGMGAGTLVNVFHALFPRAAIDAVEIDPAVVEVAREYFDFVEPAGTRVIERDGRVYVRRTLRSEARYDYIVLDAFNGDYIPEHLMTLEFLRECRELLTEDGVLVANTFSSSRLYDSESVTYEEAFGWFLNVRRRVGNRVVITARSERPERATLEARAAAFEGDLARFGIDLEEIVGLIRERPDWRRKARVLTDQYAPVNLLQGPGR